MSEYFEIHPDDPQPRLIKQAVDIIRQGGVVIYPTDSCYAIGCRIGDKASQERIRRIRQLDENHNFTLMCRDLSEISTYGKVGNTEFRLMKALTPGPYTFILQATREVPRRLQNPRRKSIGIRVPDNAIVQALLEELGEPLMSSTLILPGEDEPIDEPWDIRERLDRQVDLMIDGGHCGVQPTTVLDMSGDAVTLVREGLGPVPDGVE